MKLDRPPKGVKLKRIPGHADYLAGSDGFIYSTRYRGVVPRDRPPTPTFRRLIGQRTSEGYFQTHIVVRYGARPMKFLTHRLVCAAFHGPPPTAAHEVRHLDGSRTNNRLGNLKWGTTKENCADAKRHDTAIYGERCWAAKLTRKQVREIRRRKAAYGDQRRWAKAFGVSPYTICDVRKRKSWRWL